MSFHPPYRFLDLAKQRAEAKRASEELEAQNQSSCSGTARQKENSETADSEIEISIASYYLKEKYGDSDSSSSSNREKVEHDFRTLSAAMKNLKGGAAKPDLSPDIESSKDKEPFKPKVHHVRNLVRKALTTHYNAAEEDKDDERIFSRCLSLIQRDQHCEFLENPGGSLSWNYPRKIIIPLGYKDPNTPEFVPDVFFRYQFGKYCNLAKQAAIARCRNRFPVPVICIRKKYICRSATLSVRKSAACGYLIRRDEPATAAEGDDSFSQLWSGIKNAAKGSVQPLVKFYNALKLLLATPMDEVKDLDVRILKYLRVTYICDLMLENRKIHTGLSVGSSEKVNMTKYDRFKTIRIPYPGSKFFARYSHAGRNGRGLVYRTDVAEENRSPLKMVADCVFDGVEQPLPTIFEKGVLVDWQEYTSWDIFTLTKNYLRILLHYATKEKPFGLLIHCVSGWDRTPLFISLLRIALWADQFIHKDLEPVEIAYLTIAYDWYLFGHDLPDKLEKREEIFHFCFNFLDELVSEEYSLGEWSPEAREEMMKVREDSLREVKKIVLDIYENEVKKMAQKPPLRLDNIGLKVL